LEQIKAAVFLTTYKRVIRAVKVFSDSAPDGFWTCDSINFLVLID
jgi:hypothetical protein